MGRGRKAKTKKMSQRKAQTKKKTKIKAKIAAGKTKAAATSKKK